MVKEKISLSEKIVGSQGHKYAFLFADVKQNIQNAQNRLKEEIILDGLGSIEREIIDKIFKEEFGDELI